MGEEAAGLRGARATAIMPGRLAPSFSDLRHGHIFPGRSFGYRFGLDDYAGVGIDISKF
jgi:hypothetical protein